MSTTPRPHTAQRPKSIDVPTINRQHQSTAGKRRIGWTLRAKPSDRDHYPAKFNKTTPYHQACQLMYSMSTLVERFTADRHTEKSSLLNLKMRQKVKGVVFHSIYARAADWEVWVKAADCQDVEHPAGTEIHVGELTC